MVQLPGGNSHKIPKLWKKSIDYGCSVVPYVLVRGNSEQTASCWGDMSRRQNKCYHAIIYRTRVQYEELTGWEHGTRGRRNLFQKSGIEGSQSRYICRKECTKKRKTSKTNGKSWLWLIFCVVPMVEKESFIIFLRSSCCCW